LNSSACIRALPMQDEIAAVRQSWRATLGANMLARHGFPSLPTRYEFSRKRPADISNKKAQQFARTRAQGAP
jgi:hypothetical protein